MDDKSIITTLAADMFARKQNNSKGYVLLLGAGASISSNCPTFEALCLDYCKDRKISILDEGPIKTVKSYVAERRISVIDFYSAMTNYFKGRIPSLGYKHLANLVKQGYFSTILTTNFDCLLEMAISKLIDLDDFKVLVRGEIEDDVIANMLKLDLPNKVNIIKMHGDLTSGVFFITDQKIRSISDSLKRQIAHKTTNGCIVVGHSMQDSDIVETLSEDGGCSSLYYVNPDEPTEQNGVQPILSDIVSGNINAVFGDLGEFDSFFMNLDMELQRRYVSADKQVKRRGEIEKEILEKQERGSGYINYSSLIDLIDEFERKVRKFNPSCVVFINDPTAPGGMEVKRRLQDRLQDRNIYVTSILIAGEGAARSFKREVRSSKEDLGISEEMKNILVVDAITFSGNTLVLAIKKLEEWFPCVKFRAGVLILDEILEEKIRHENEDCLKLQNIIYGKLTNRSEIFFPWGVTQATQEHVRSFCGLADNTYDVCISRRPWGGIEIFVDEKLCSVRILTIEADQRLSFQRHLCRDEFFVSIDDNIGLELCGEDIGDVVDKQFSDIPNIHALVLERGDYILIPRGVWHRFRASKERVRVLEIGYGIYDQDHDIERKEDKFKRDPNDGSV